MQPFIDHAAAVASLRSIATAATTAADNLAATDKALVFGAGLESIKKDGEPPLFGMMLTCVGDLTYRAMADGFLGGPGANLPQNLKDNLTASADACDAHKGDFVNFGQAMRDAMAAL